MGSRPEQPSSTNPALPIALDAMGGDHAPAQTALAAVQAVRELGVSLLLVGDRQKLLAELAGHPLDRIQIHHASQVVEMGESPGQALRKKPDSSILVAANLVRDGLAAGMVSAGNSGAAMAAAVLSLGTIPGLERPAIATVLPTIKGKAVLLDAGANTDCKPRQLYQFALMGSIYAEHALGVPRATVGLLSIGEEASKGNELTRQSYSLLSQGPFEFVGNVEGTGLFEGAAQVVVCDGFVGNVVLKVGEGFAELLRHWLRQELARRPIYSLGGWVLRPALEAFRRRADYAEYGGALLLGINGVCVISHGRSNAKAIVKAISVARESARGRVVERIRCCFEEPALELAGKES